MTRHVDPVEPDSGNTVETAENETTTM